MLILLTLLLPPALLVGMLVMERVERPLRHEAIGEQLAEFLDEARPDEVETYISHGASDALERYWRRTRRRRLLPRRS